MRIHTQVCGILVTGCVLGATLTPCTAAVTDDEFDALKKAVQQLGEKVQKLEQTHEQDQQTHQQDQQHIQQLQQQLDQTHQIATNAVQKAETAAQVQPVAPLPPGPAATHNFQLAGDAEVLFGRVQGQKSAFALADFAPIFLYRASDNVLFEAGFDFTLSNGTQPVAPAGGGPIGNSPNFSSGTSYNFDLSFATIDYLLNDYVTVVAGDMLLPLGTYSERSAGWLNKFPDNPLPRGLLPGSGLGAQLRGAIPVGNSGQMVTYSVYGVNGPSSTDGSGSSGSLDLGGNVGILNNSAYADTTTYGSLGNLHSNPSGGGRIGWFYPLKAHYDLELGLSGQSGEWDDLGDYWSAFVVDAALHVGPYVEVKGEYISSWVDTTDLGTIHPNGWWVQAGYKLSGLNLDLPLINNLELVGRYDTSNDALIPNTTIDRYTAGFVYYFSNTLLFEGDYEWLHSAGFNANQVPSTELLMQLSYGF
ncbi:MAG: hypothetical protein ACLQU3_11170 [Limisphaerales bacterium]